ncbi:I78 family peptidase inhibitor [Sphingopyxis sp. CCNWLW253]|uniref:I78 family peptidase inhibitor n=1 Tax=unclassified Sphingopyxis TaxID=2614943 RepID=UPI003012E424
MFNTKIAVFAFAGLLTACSTTVQDTPATSLCRSDVAAMLVGHAAPDDAQIKQRTGAKLTRRITPGDPVTHDLRENRITLAINPAGKVVQAVCG